jgi:TatD DNase family protein
MIDTHVHFSDLTGDYTLDSQMQRALAAGVDKMVAVGGSCELNKSAVEAAELYPQQIAVAIGFDRSQVVELNAPALIEDAVGRLRRSADALRKLGVRVCAIGEIGLDYHYTPGTRDGQVALFRAQCDLAAELGLPVIVHSREADDDTVRVLAAYVAKCRKGVVPGVLHCFTGSAPFAQHLLALGMMISFSGIVTFLNADPLRIVAAGIPADRLLIETDSPYLAPVPHRGKRNEPAFVRDVAARLAQVRGVSLDAVDRQTTENALQLFGI